MSHSSAQLNLAAFGVFLTLELTEIILFIGSFGAGSAKTTGNYPVRRQAGVLRGHPA